MLALLLFLSANLISSNALSRALSSYRGYLRWPELTLRLLFCALHGKSSARVAACCPWIITSPVRNDANVTIVTFAAEGKKGIGTLSENVSAPRVSRAQSCLRTWRRFVTHRRTTGLSLILLFATLIKSVASWHVAARAIH